MAEGSSRLESNISSDDLINNGILEIIDFQLGLSRIDNLELHEVNLSISVDQIDGPHVEKGQELVANSSQIEKGLKRDEKTEIKKEKRPRKRGKGLKKHLNDDFERQSVCDCDKRGDRARVMYSKEEIEGLRYVGMELQKKKWIEVYCGLGSAVAKEYDNLVGSKYDEEGNYVSFDPRPQFANKKGVAPDFIGDGSENIGCEKQNMNQVDHLSGVNVDDFDGEEDYYEDEDSDSEYASIQRPALYVTGEPDFDSGPPQDGLEYLRRVRWEAKRIPKVKIAKVERKVLNKEQTVYMPNIPDIAACPHHLMPSKEWEDVFLADFSKLRLALSEVESSASTFSEQIESIPLAQSIIDNAIQENLDVNQTEEKTVCDWPSLQTIIEMEPRARVTMLRKRITSIEQMSCLGRPDCAWLFALCAAIDTPLDGDTSASLRCLLRKCATLRAEKTSLDDEVIMLNILATISGNQQEYPKMERISKLPVGIIETILCLLPIQEAVRTSILSREWRYHWIKIPKLVFIEDKYQVSTDGSVLDDKASKRKEIAKRRKLFYAIYQVLLMHQGPILEFTLSMKVDGSCVEIDNIILHLSKKNTVKILKLDFLYDGYEGYTLPISLFSLHQLTDMHLNDCSLFHERSFNEFGCLTTLHLESVYTYEKTLMRLLSSCPLLKRLTLDSDGATVFDSGRSTIADLFECLPVLEYLSVTFFIVKCFVPNRLPKELPTTLVHLKYLCMDSVCFIHEYGLPFLVLLIRSSPNLEKLKLVMYDDRWLEEDDMGSFTFEYYSDIMFEHLNQLEIVDFSDSENELDFVKLILAKSPVLKK
ncbi:hypothetical protein L1987_82075 [Smallanthus sonchifolius]|uniref:Uncharacterized protein n=1 Tax=Smallanthus sonchifolius TaxID=185202 RepID=A0ACB8YSH6_9ASTR|nr:hypothetical protein L1987_82075 [Smallanthus sonchifolius]